MVQYGRIWSHMVGFGSKSGQQKSNKNMFPEMSQNLLEMVPMASGGPGNRSLLYNNASSYYNKGPFFPIIYYPYSPVKFPIPLGREIGEKSCPQSSLFRENT